MGIKVKKTVFYFSPSQIYYSQLCCLGLAVSTVVDLRKHIKSIKDTLRGEVKKVERSKTSSIATGNLYKPKLVRLIRFDGTFSLDDIVVTQCQS